MILLIALLSFLPITCQSLDCTQPAGCAVTPCRTGDSIPTTTPTATTPTTLSSTPPARFTG